MLLMAKQPIPKNQPYNFKNNKHVDEKKITAIYLELHAQVDLLVKKAKQTADNAALREEMNQLRKLLGALEENAQKVGIDLTNKKATPALVLNDQDDWKQLVESSTIGKTVKAALITQLEKLATPPTAVAVWPVIQTIDKYYTANVRNANNMRIINHQKEVLKGRHLDPNVDGIKVHQDVAQTVLLEKIEQLTAGLALQAEQDLHPRFEELYKQALLDNSTGIRAVGADVGSTAQFKKQLAARDFPQYEGKQVGPLVFRDWKLEGSIKVDYTTEAHLLKVVVDDTMEDYLNLHVQAFRRTISLDKAWTKFQPKDYSITLVSGALELVQWSYGSVFLKTELKGIKLENILNKAIKTGVAGELFVMNLRFQVTLDLLKTPVIGGSVAALSDKMSLQRAVATLSLGATLNVDVAKLKILLQGLKTATQKVATKLSEEAKEIAEKTKGLRQKLFQQADELKELTEQAMKKQQPNQKALKAVTDSFKEHTDELKKVCEKFIKKGPAAKEAAEKLLLETGEAIARKLGPKVMGFMGKVAARAVPGIGTAMLIYDIGSLVWMFGNAVYATVKNVNASNMRWEDQVAAWLKSLGE